MNFRQRYMRWRMSPAAYLIWELLQDPKAWGRQEHCLVHEKINLSLWVSDNRKTFAVAFNINRRYPSLGNKYEGFSRFEKRQLYKLAKPIWSPPPPTRKELERQLFDWLMRAQLGEEKAP